MTEESPRKIEPGCREACKGAPGGSAAPRGWWPGAPNEMTSFIVMDVLEKACELECQGVDVVHLEVGEPDFDAPACVTEAAVPGAPGRFYPLHPQPGHPRTAGGHQRLLSDTYERHRGPGPDRRHLGQFAGHFHAVRRPAGARRRGDPARSLLCLLPQLHQLRPGPLRHGAGPRSGRVSIHPEAIQAHITPRTRAIVINSPANPTGTLLPPTACGPSPEMGPYVISDEIYHGLVYEGRAHSILEFTDRAFVINGFPSSLP
jgi:(5-formylfuran-3-yl)methyl phosphate transaminase